MHRQTYLQNCLHNHRTMRWLESAMPLKVYIAPYRFYSNSQDGASYMQLAANAFNYWEQISKGRVTFTGVGSLMESQINLDWKRVDRSSLGRCYFDKDSNNRLFSAEIEIGISDGIIHADYMNESEVYHTILHEVGHSIGLGHSPYLDDIMYTPHQYGITNLSARDIQTINWLYAIPNNISPEEFAGQNSVATNNMDDVVMHLAGGRISREPLKQRKKKRDLLEEQEMIADYKKYNVIALQNIKIQNPYQNKYRNK